MNIVCRDTKDSHSYRLLIIFKEPLNGPTVDNKPEGQIVREIVKKSQ